MAGTPIAAARINTEVPADTDLYITSAASADVDLAAVSTKPNHCPQAVMFINSTAGALAVVFTTERGASRSLSVPANMTITSLVPVRSITAAGSGAVQVWAFWWSKSGVQFNR